MATITLTRGKTLPDSGVKKDLHDLIDLTTGTVSSIVNADVSASAAIAGTKISPNFGSQDVVCADIQASGDVAISGTIDLGDHLTLTTAKFGTSFPATPTADYVYKESTLKAGGTIENESSPAFVVDYNCDSVTWDSSNGEYDITFATAMSSADYIVMATVSLENADKGFATIRNKATTGFSVYITIASGANVQAPFDFAVFGSQA